MAQEELSREEMLAKLQELAPELQKVMRQFGAHEPDWAPLEKVLPLKECAGFMFMGYSDGLRLYKHGFTRNYLIADSEGQTYAYCSDSKEYFRIPRKLAVSRVFDGLKEVGAKRTTPWNEKALQERHRAIAEAGNTMIRVEPDGVKTIEPER